MSMNTYCDTRIGAILFFSKKKEENSTKQKNTPDEKSTKRAVISILKEKLTL